MKNKLFILFFCALSALHVYGRTDIERDSNHMSFRYGVGGGMGLSAISINDLSSYLNFFHVAGPGERLSEFSTAVEFFVTADYFINENLSGGFEYSYILASHNLSSEIGTNNFRSTFHMPVIMMNYVIGGINYFFKFGGGLGYILARYEEDLVYLPDPLIYTGQGLGGKLQAVGYTPFGDNLFGYIGVDMRFGFPGSVKDTEGRKLKRLDDDVRFDFFTFGIKFGISYFF